jgi:hypothetical protein
VRRADEEAEIRAFDVARRAFYRGTLMVAASGPVDWEAVGSFVQPRVAARRAAERPPAARATVRPRSRWWQSWWFWAIAGGAVIAVGTVAYFADPSSGEAEDVRLRIVAP